MIQRFKDSRFNVQCLMFNVYNIAYFKIIYNFCSSEMAVSETTVSEMIVFDK